MFSFEVFRKFIFSPYSHTSRLTLHILAMDTFRLRFASCFDNHPYAVQHQIAQNRYKVPSSYFALSTQQLKLCGIDDILEFALVFNDAHNGNTMLLNAVKSVKTIQLKEVSDHTSVTCEKSLPVNHFYESGAQSKHSH